MQLTFTLQSAYTGATYVAGPFNISGTTANGSDNELATNVSKEDLVSGYDVYTTLETLTGGTIQSVGTCGTSQAWYVGTPSDIYYVVDSGDYPRSNEGSTLITIHNNTGSSIYLYLRGNSQSTNSGDFDATLMNDTAQQILLNDPINGYAQVNYTTLPLVLSQTSEQFTLTRTTGSVSGPVYSIYYSLTNGGSKLPLPLPV